MKPNEHTVLITGGGSGIGLALAKRFYAEGNRLILAGRNDARLKAAREALGQDVELYSGDVADETVIGELARRYPEVNVLVNNAGVQHMYNVLNAPDYARQIKEELRVNLIAPALLCGAFLPGLLRHVELGREAAIVNVSSGLALAPKASAPTYCASKAGLHSFTKALRYQLESSGVRVFETLPPLVDTEMTRGRGKGKISADELAREFWTDWLNNKFEMRIGKTKLLALVQRLAPALADRIMRGL